MIRITRSFLTAIFFSGFATAGGPEARLVEEQPREGRFVKTERGFMVPYQQRIPGSNAVIDMLPVPGGSIMLASVALQQDEQETDAPSAAQNTEAKTRKVSFGPFWIGKFEITMQQYLPYRSLYYQQKKAAAKHRRADKISLTDIDAVTGPTEVYAPRFNFEYTNAPDSPVPSASQFATRQYTKWLSRLTGETYRLPYRSEWQHACLAGSQSQYCFGDDVKQLSDYAVYLENVDDDPLTLRVGTKKPNAWGLHDVHGNVSEFVIDSLTKRKGQYGHVACGGNAESDADDCRVTSMIQTTEDWWDEDANFPRSPWWMTSYESRFTGFRIISPLKEMSAAEKRQVWDPDSEDLLLDVQSRIDGGRGSVGRVNKPKPTTRRIDSPVE